MVASKELEPASDKNNSVLSDIGRVFTSVRTTVVLLFVLAFASILGTVIPQEATSDLIQQIGSSFSYRLIVILDLHNVFRSWWFILLLVLLSLNLVGCLVERLPRIPEEWRAASGGNSFDLLLSDSRDSSRLKEIVSSSVSKVLRASPRVSETDEGLTMVWLKDRIHLLGFPFIHLAIITILVGGLIGLLYGMKGKIQIVEGEARSRFTLILSGETAKLPFEIAVDRFALTRYPTGEPKEFRSDVRLLVDGKEALKGSILVNDPLTFQGISLYQSDYRVLGIKEVRFEITGPSGDKTLLPIKPRETVQLPGTSYQLQLKSLDRGATRKGPGVDIEVQGPDEPPKSVELFKHDTEPVKLGDSAIRFADYSLLYATGLQIGYDPGARVVWAGCILLVVGFYLSLFSNYRVVRVVIRSEKSGSSIRVSGRSKRLRRELRESVDKAVREAISKET